nr:unnamed protein product [Callosobruchus analis]
MSVADPFARRSSLNRSPPRSRRGSVSSVGSEKSTSSKRRRAKDDGLDAWEKIKGMLDRLRNVAREAQDHLKNNRNTKSEIKTAINRMDYQIEEIISEMEQTSQSAKSARIVGSPGICVGTQTDLIEQVSMAVQTIPVDQRRQEEQEREERARIEIENSINTGEGRFEDLAKILDKAWPEGVFNTVKEIEGNPFKIAEKKNIILLVDPKHNQEKGIVRDAIERFPEIKEILADGCTDGKVEFVINETRTSRKRDGEKDQTTVYILPYTVHQNGVNDMQGVFDLFASLRKELSVLPRDLALVTPDGLDRLYVRKIVEFIMRGRCDKVEYFSRSKQRPEEERRGATRNAAVKERQQQGNVIVKAGSRGYADLLKTVKEKVDVDKMGVSVKSIRKTAADDLSLNTEGKEMAEVLGNAIKQQITDSEVIVRKGEKTLHVADIDAVTSKEQIAAALEQAAGPNTVGHFEVGELRPTRNGNQTAVITAPRASAEQLIRIGTVRIGLVSCQVREWVRLRRWDDKRRDLELRLGINLSPEELMNEILNNEDSWYQVAAYVEEILREKKMDQRSSEINLDGINLGHGEGRVMKNGSSKRLWNTLQQTNVYSNNNPNPPDYFDDPNSINEYFIQSVERIDTKINDNTLNCYSTHRISGNPNSFYFSQVNEKVVTVAMNSIKSNAAGSDGFNLFMLPNSNISEQLEPVDKSGADLKQLTQLP